MASTNKCEYCGSTITSKDKNCPKCGAPNPLYIEDKPRVILTPHTIEELQEFCAERGMPLFRMRFFIGEDFKEPRAFGIYRKPNGDVVVYKNKDTGERAIRYEGPDEEHGVTELYLKLLDECHRRGIYPETPDGKPPKDYIHEKNEDRRSNIAWLLGIASLFITFYIPAEVTKTPMPTIAATFLSLIPIGILIWLIGYCVKKRRTAPAKSTVEHISKISSDTHVASKIVIGKTSKRLFTVFITYFCILLILASFFAVRLVTNPVGYYKTENGLYYHIGSDWYRFNGEHDSRYFTWYSVDDIDTDYSEYEGTNWENDWGSTLYDFTESQAWDNYVDSHSGGSSYDSWDSSDTDWSSDW